VQAGGAKIDTNGYTIGVSQALTSGAATDGGLIKQGAGEMYISATPSYNGVTAISGGSVVLDRSSLPGAVSVSAGATLRLSNPSGLTGTYYNTGVSDIGVYNSLSTLNTYLATLTPDAATHNSKEAGAFLDMGDGGQYFPAGYNSSPHDNFQVVWTGMFHAATAGTYNFATASDDGSMLFLDGNAVVNNNNWQGVTRHTGSVTLTAGDHPITIAFYQGGGGYGMWAEVQQPGQQWQYLANDMLTSTDALTAQAFGVGSLSGAGNVDLGGALNTLTVNQTADGTLSGVVSGSGSLVKDGSATLTLTQDIAYTGDTVVNAGTLTAQNMTTSPNISVLGTATLNATSIVADTLTIGGTPLASAAVPEPGTLALLALAALALAGVCLRRR
jgi:autotransporter-associated beta strand protein